LDPIITQAAEKSTCCRPGVCLTLLMAGMVVLRIAYWSPGLSGSDSAIFCQAILLRTFVAFPPGYTGYVALGTLLNALVGNVYLGLVLMSAFSQIAAIPLVYWLSREAGLSLRAALLAAAAFALSLNTMYFGGIGLNYACEGLASALIGGALFRAVRLGCAGWALAGTVAWSALGAIRPTTTVLLAPLWLYMMERVFIGGRRSPALAVACVAAGVALGAAWSYANRHFLHLAGSDESSFVTQAYMGGGFDYTSTDLNKAQQTTQVHSYHWPAVEMAAWVEDHVHIHLLPRPASIPAPSLGRAFRLLILQGGKMAFYLLFSSPLLLIVPAAWLVRRGGSDDGQGPDRSLLAIYVAPALLFFLFGHFGSFGYLLVILPGIMAIAAATIDSAASKALFRLSSALLAASLLFFCLARPISATSSSRTAVNILALQYTGYGLNHQISLARAAALTNYQTLPADARAARGNRQILAACQKVNAASKAEPGAQD
jgi:hypothetical protein